MLLKKIAEDLHLVFILFLQRRALQSERKPRKKFEASTDQFLIEDLHEEKEEEGRRKERKGKEGAVVRIFIRTKEHTQDSDRQNSETLSQKGWIDGNKPARSQLMTAYWAPSLTKTPSSNEISVIAGRDPGLMSIHCLISFAKRRKFSVGQVF